MSNVCDYIKWRGDLELSQSEFNEIDNLILSRFSYFPFDKIINYNEVITIKELGERFSKQDIKKLTILWKDDIELFPIMSNSKRFGTMKATKFVNKIEVENEKQFSAITIIMPDNTLYVSFRGTDNTIVGWKEDFNMSFKSHIASQISAKEYLNMIAELYPNKKIRVGGHSKGGNIAVYSAIIGRLMNHKEKYTIIESTQKGIMQHDLYSWQILGKEFITLPNVTNESEFIDKTIKEWLENVEPAKREQVINVIFEILNSTDAQTTKELRKNLFSNIKVILEKYKNIDPETKEMIAQTANALIKIVKNNLKNT